MPQQMKLRILIPSASLQAGWILRLMRREPVHPMLSPQVTPHSLSATKVSTCLLCANHVVSGTTMEVGHSHFLSV